MNASNQSVTRLSQLNCRNFLPFMHALHQLLQFGWRSDIACFSETWLTPTTPDSLLTLQNFTHYRRDRTSGRRGGGLLIYVRSHFRATRRVDLETNDIECLAVELVLSSTKCYLVLCYRPPNSCQNTFFLFLNNLLHKLENTHSLILLVGDFNAKHSSWNEKNENDSAGRRLADLFADFRLTQLVTKPTCFSSTGENSNVLDLISTTCNCPEKIAEVTVTSPVSDHCCVLSEILLAPPRCSKRVMHVPDYENADLEELFKTLSNTPLLDAVRAQDVNTAWNDWSLLVTKAVEHHIPKRTITIRPQNKRKNKPWMNSSLHKLSREKNRLFRSAKNPQSPVTWEQYKSARNRFNSQLRQTQNQYFARLDNELRHLRPSSAAWWVKAKRIAKISSPPQLIPPIQSSSGTIADSDGEKADVLAQFFAKQCNMFIHGQNRNRLPRCTVPSPRELGTRPSPSRRFRSQPCSAIYVNYQRTKLQLCRMDSQTGFSKQLPQQLPNLLRTSSICQ